MNLSNCFIAASALLSVACAAPDLQEDAASIRQEIYEMTDVGASEDLLFDAFPYSLAELRRRFATDEAGVWCGGAALSLQRAYAEAGYESWTLNYGFMGEPGLLTHVTVLVRIGDEIYLQDAYLNFDYPVPFFDVVEMLARGETPTARVQGGLRDVLVHQRSVPHSWAVEPGAACDPLPNRDGVMRCRSAANLTLFQERYMSADGLATLDRLEELGHPRDLSFLLLYPIEIYDGTITQGAEHPIIRRMLDAAAARGRQT